MNQQETNQLIKKIKEKKELSAISDTFVKKELQQYLKQYPKVSLNPRSRHYKKLVKEIRAKLRRTYGLFQIDLKKNKNLLAEHPSTKERLSFYPQLYRKIFQITGKPKTILDLGCGVNPLSVKYMKLDNFTYYAYDLSKEEVKLINQFFKKNKIKGQAEILDLLNFKNLPKADLAFLFKMTDVLDQGKGHKKSEEVIKKIPAKYLVVSFPTLTMSGKRMNFPRRRWIELMCQRLNYKFKILEFSSEIFYVVEKLS